MNFVSPENVAFHSELLTKTIDSYIPAPLLKNVEQAKRFLNSLQPYGINLKQVLQSFLDKSDHQLKMYGNVDDLLADLKIYQNFPLKHKKFGIDGHTLEAMVDCPKEPVKHKSIRGELFFNKHNFLHHLYSRIHAKYAVNISGTSPEVLVCMKRNEKKLDGCYEFFRCDDATLPEVQQMILKLLNNPHDKTQNFFSQIMQNVNSGVSATSEENKSDAELLQKIINSYPRIFLPNAESNHLSASIVVRIFEDAGQKFVMKSELFKDDRISSSDEYFQSLKDENGVLWTIDANKVFRTLGSEIIGSIQFISVPIQRAKHAAVPIVTPSGDHCILASDVVYELLRRLISALKVFQNFNRDGWQTVTRYIDLLNSVIPINATHKFFIDTTKFDKFKCETDDFWTKTQTGSSKNVFRDVGIYGFDVDFLKEELKILELSTAFPDIIDKADIAYEYVFKMRRGPTLETSDLIDAVEVCQLICLLEKCPQLKDFFHNQNYCNRIPGIQCNQCSSPPSRFPTLIPWSDTSNLKEIQVKPVEKETKKCEVSIAPSSSRKVTKTTDLGKKKKEVVSSEDIRGLGRVQEVSKSPITEEITEKSSIENSHQNDAETKKDLELVDLCDKNVDDLKKKLAEAEKRVEMTEKNKELEMKKQAEKYEKMTSKCESLELRIKELDEESTAEIQEQAEKYQQKVKKYKELEKKMKEMEREMKENEKKMKELGRKKDTELYEYKTKMIESHEAKDKRIRIHSIKARDSTEEIKKLKSAIARLEAENVKVKEQNNQFVQKLAEKPNGLEEKEKQISEKNRIIEELKEANRKLISEKEAARKVIQDTISMSSTQLQMLQRLLTVSPSSETTFETPIEKRETSDSSKTQLRNLQIHRDWMSDKKEIELAKNMVKRLVYLSNRPDIHLLGEHELLKFEGDIQSYLQAVEVHIKILQESGDVSRLPQLPERPQLSEKLVSELWSEVDRVREHEVKDSVCYFCLANVEANQKTLQCVLCKKFTHLECASTWLKTKQTCGNCRGHQLDPDEYPPLG